MFDAPSSIVRRHELIGERTLSMDIHEEETPCLPVGWGWFAIAPVLPFVLGAGILQLCAPWQVGGVFVGTNAVIASQGHYVSVNGEPERELNLDLLKLLGVGTTSEPTVAFSHLGNQLTYSAAALLQMMTGAVVIILQARFLFKLNGSVRNTSIRILFLTMLLALATICLIDVTKAATYQYSFLTIQQLLRSCPGFPAQFATGGDSGILFSQSRLFYAALLPFFVGAMAVGVMSASSASIAARDNNSGKDWEANFAARLTQLQNFFRMSSVILVASAIAFMSFVQLPVGLMNEATAPAVAKFAQGLTVYWGSVMTLTLVAVFALPVIALRGEARIHYSTTQTDQTFSEWLNDRGHLSVKRHLANLATMLAPVLVGPVGALVHSMFGA